ncbi:MAG: SIS domain-containing protein, partial [Dysgonamonadaceae bacterium]
MLALQWLENAYKTMEKIEKTQLDNIKAAALLMADSIEKKKWVHTFGCGHATIPVEEMYPRIGSFVGFHPLVELPLTFFTQIIGQMGIHQFLFLERTEGYGVEIMKNYDFDAEDTLWLFSHTGINAVNIDVAIEAKKRGM